MDTEKIVNGNGGDAELRVVPRRDDGTESVKTAFRIPPAKPGEITTAICQVKSHVTRLAKTEKNNHGGYNYANVDQFFEMIAPLEAEAGITVDIHHAGAPRPQVVKTRSGEQTVLVYPFVFSISHASGKNWCDPEDVMYQPLPFMGAQTVGAARSFALKAYLRTLYRIATGEPDADAQEKWDDVDVQARTQAHKDRARAGKPQTSRLITFVFDKPHALAAADVVDRVKEYLGTAPQDIRQTWARDNSESLQMLHVQNKPIWLQLKRFVDGTE